MQAYETRKVNGYTIKVYPDDGRVSPRTWTNAGVMVCDHNRYDLGDRKPTDSEFRAARKDWSILARYLRRYEGATCVLPLSLYDHGGTTMRVGFASGWDSGVVGFIYDTPETRADTGATDVEASLRGDVEVYDQYLTGDVWGFVISKPNGDIEESCWGFYGMDECLNEAVDIAKGMPKIRRVRVHVKPNLTMLAYA